jgi:predicted PhzF superfamily epimerase YddE/YHI9
VLALQPDFSVMTGLHLGVVAPWEAGRFEVRAFTSEGVQEDPVTGSLNASLGQWLIGAGLAAPAYVASQGTVLGRAGLVYVRQEGAEIWVGGDCVTVIEGTVTPGVRYARSRREDRAPM